MVESRNTSGASRVWAVSVHDKVLEGRNVDIRHIAEALGRFIDDYKWAIAVLDGMGEGANEVCDQAAQAAQEGRLLVFNAEELRRLAQSVTQTIDARIFGMPLQEPDIEQEVQVAESGRFLESQAEVLLYVADNSLYVVVTKKQEHIWALKASFSFVRDEDPMNFC